MRLLTNFEKREYYFLLQFIEAKDIEIKPVAPPEDFKDVMGDFKLE